MLAATLINASSGNGASVLRDGIHDSDLTPYLTCLINDAHLDKTALIVAHEERGEDHRLLAATTNALADFTRAIELDPNDAWAITSRGQTYQAMERYDDALADFTRAIELDPGTPRRSPAAARPTG